MKQNATHGGCDHQPTSVGRFSYFPLRTSLPTGGINSKYISETFVGTIYGEAERARAISNILGMGFFILCNESSKLNAGRI